MVRLSDNTENLDGPHKNMIACRHIQVLVSITVLGKGHCNKPRIRVQYSDSTIMLILHPRTRQQLYYLC